MAFTPARLYAIEAAGGAARWTERHYDDELKSAEGRLYPWPEGASDDAALGGFVLWRLVDDEAWILQIAVEAKGRGGGQRLLASFVAALPASVASVGLEVASRNGPACRLYERAGFTIVGRRTGYYRDGDDALVMRLDLRARGG